MGEDEVAEYVRAYSRPGALRAGFAYYRALRGDVPQNIAYAKTKLRMPILAIGGALSHGDEPFRQLQVIAEDVKGAVIENAGHHIASEQPEELALVLTKFFNTN
jgi:pimeloyl-ACP methyl ester carboxylesterase